MVKVDNSIQRESDFKSAVKDLFQDLQSVGTSKLLPVFSSLEEENDLSANYFMSRGNMESFIRETYGDKVEAVKYFRNEVQEGLKQVDKDEQNFNKAVDRMFLDLQSYNIRELSSALNHLKDDFGYLADIGDLKEKPMSIIFNKGDLKELISGSYGKSAVAVKMLSEGLQTVVEKLKAENKGFEGTEENRRDEKGSFER